MAISIENELENESDLFSPFMRPVLYFSVSGAGSVTDPTAEVIFNGTTEDVTFDAVFIKTLATIHYFSLDLSDVMPHLMRYFDGGNYPDDLEIINGNLLQIFHEYFRALVMDIYFERGTADEQTISVSHIWLHLADQMPTEHGFRLGRVYNHSCLQNLKWSKNTYNAIFFWSNAGALTISKGTAGGSESYTADSTIITADNSTTVDGGLISGGGTTIYSGNLAAAGFYQYKFAKTSIYLDRGLNVITITNGTGSKTITIDYDPDCADVFALCWQHPLLGYVSYPFNGNKVTNVSAKKRAEFDKYLTTLVNINTLKEITGYDHAKKLTLTTKADSQYWPLLEYLYSSRHVYLFVGADGQGDSSLTWVECEVSGGCSYRSDRMRGTFTVELTLPETFNVKF